MKLVLFDIDGTLIRANGVGKDALSRAVSSLTNRPISTDPVSFSGRTDPDIFQAVLAHNDLPTSDEAVTEAIDAYVETVMGTLSPDNIELLPGVRTLLDTLHEQPAIHLGLLTGNVEPVALEKLSVHGLGEYFPVGAFGSDHADRNELPSIAIRRASDHTGDSFRSGDQIVIVGDTVHDIQCARAAGARAVAVCTGRYDRAALEPYTPDLLMDTLRTPDSFIRYVLDS